QILQGFCLSDRSRKAIEKESVAAIIFCQPFLHNSNCHFIRNKRTLIHICFCLFTKFSSFFNCGTEYITCLNMLDMVCFVYFFCLCFFSGTRNSHQNSIRFFPLLSLSDVYLLNSP